MTEAKKHTLEMIDRKTLTVSGIDDVISFDEGCIVLSGVCGIMSVDGTELRIIGLALDTGCVEISGNINGIIYPENSKSGGFFRKKQK